MAQGGTWFRVLRHGRRRTAFAFGTWVLYKQHVLSFRSDLAETQWGAIVGFFAGLIAMVIATRFMHAQTAGRSCKGLVLGLQEQDVQTTARIPWFKSPVLIGAGALVLCALLYVYIAVV